MQSIVADTTPLNYLVLIQAADILPELYRTVLIPPAVKAELAHANTPAVVRAWISQPPAWLEVVSPSIRLWNISTQASRGDIACVRTPSHPFVDG